MGQIQVTTPELAVAAVAIGRLGSDLGEARAAISAAQGEVGAFGDEPIGSAFAQMCERASQATAEFDQTTSQLSHNVAMASLGYVTTDEGVIPVRTLGPEGKNP
jgi:hypothetical protein